MSKKVSEITERQIRNGLRRVMKKLINGEIKAENFDMNVTWCGTVGCIGGHLAAELGIDADNDDRALFAIQPWLLPDGERLRVLFFGHPPGRVTRKGAASAIKRYLEGKRIWR